MLRAAWNLLAGLYDHYQHRQPLAPFDEMAIRFYVAELKAEGKSPRPAEIWNPDLLLYNARERMLPYGWAVGGMALRPASKEKILKAAGLAGPPNP